MRQRISPFCFPPRLPLSQKSNWASMVPTRRLCLSIFCTQFNAPVHRIYIKEFQRDHEPPPRDYFHDNRKTRSANTLRRTFASHIPKPRSLLTCFSSTTAPPSEHFAFARSSLQRLSMSISPFRNFSIDCNRSLFLVSLSIFHIFERVTYQILLQVISFDGSAGFKLSLSFAASTFAIRSVFLLWSICWPLRSP